jgi:hypothetical protein
VDGRDKPGHDEIRGSRPTPSFRDGPKDQTRNLDVMKIRKTQNNIEIPGSALRAAPE